jgi:hypothetical protein
MQIAPTGFPGHLNGILIFRCRATSGSQDKSHQNLPDLLTIRPQFDACSHVRAPCPPVARLELYVPSQAPEFQREIIPSVVDLRPQHFQIPHVFAPKPPQQLAKEHVLYKIFAGAGFCIVRGIRRLGGFEFGCLRHLPAFRIGRDGNSLPAAGKSTGKCRECSNRVR